MYSYLWMIATLHQGQATCSQDIQNGCIFSEQLLIKSSFNFKTVYILICVLFLYALIIEQLWRGCGNILHPSIHIPTIESVIVKGIHTCMKTFFQNFLIYIYMLLSKLLRDILDEAIRQKKKLRIFYEHLQVEKSLFQGITYFEYCLFVVVLLYAMLKEYDWL